MNRAPQDPAAPPPRADAFLASFCAPDLLEEIQGDLHELHRRRVRSHGPGRARLRYWWDVLWFLRPYVLRRSSPYDQARGPIMWKNYLTVSARNLRKYTGTSAINVTGLAIGMACCIAVLVFVRDESGYDAYHANGERLYRLSLKGIILSTGEELNDAASPILWGPALQRDYPDVVDYTRFVRLPSPDRPWTVTHGDRTFPEHNLLHADPSVFDLFSWTLLRGDPATALSEPRNVVLTASTARKYFGDDDPLGQTLTLDPGLRGPDGAPTGETFDYTVTGVLQDVPRRSHFTFDALLSTQNLNEIYGGDVVTGTDMGDWFWRGRIAYTYLLLRDGADPAALEARFPDFQERYLGDMTVSRGYTYEPFLQRIDRIYLGGNLSNQLQPVGDRTTLYLFALIAGFILLIACVNFMNLTTARATSRAREVGLRKVVGAHRHQLVAQFLGESVLLSLIAFVLALGLARLLLPALYGYLGKAFVFDLSENGGFLILLLGVGVLVGVVAGGYPAFILSRFSPATVLKGGTGGAGRGGRLRKGLVVFQFAISTFLIIATLTVFRQVHFMRTHDLGFDQDHVLVLPPPLAPSLVPHLEALRDDLLRNPRITHVTASSSVPGQGSGGDIYVAEGRTAEDGFGLGEYLVDYDFVETFGLELRAGRDFSRDAATDGGRTDDDGRLREVAALLNESAVRQFGWTSPEEALGRRIIRDPRSGDWTATVVGVVKDFHHASLHEPIAPGALILAPRYRYLSVKIGPGDAAPVVAFIEEAVRRIAPDAPFTYTFLDASFDAQYAQDALLGEVFGYVSFLAVFIACLGLFGLATFTAEQRTREIGIRKVLGASVSRLVTLLSAGFVRLVGLAFIVAVPLAYIVLNRWLDSFAYRTELSWETFLSAGLMALGVAILTVIYQSIRAALADPVRTLRHE